MESTVNTAGTQGGGSTAPPALRAVGVAKTFPGVRALRGVDVTIEPGEVRGLVGANGSGKSTFIKIIAGAQAPDPGGQIEICGQELNNSRPWEARALGVATIYQELTIVPTLSAVDNVFLGEYISRGPFMATAKMDEEFRQLCDRLAVSLNPRTPAAAMSVADLTIVEIIRAIRLDARLLIMDEVTATLGPRERERLYSLMQVLSGQGVAIIFVSHDLNEVLNVSHSTTVFRDGDHIRTAPKAEWTHDALVGDMLGARAKAVTDGHSAGAAILASAVEEVATEAHHPAVGAGKPLVLSARNVGVPGVIEDVTVEAAAGEIVGIAGLVGSGRTTLLKALAGAIPVSSGEMVIDGKPVSWPRDVAKALGLGIALLPEDRKREGLILGLPTYDNVTLSKLGKVARWMFLTQRDSVSHAERLLEQVDFRGQITAPTGSLSGGNQQKALFAKWLHFGPHVYLIDEPTRGVDIGAKREMLGLIRNVADEGNAFVVVSSEFEELEAVCDRVLVLLHGRIVAELRGDDMKVDRFYDVLFAGDENAGTDAVPGSR
jgi:rhamnose transport system ATP-binding protein